MPSASPTRPAARTTATLRALLFGGSALAGVAIVVVGGSATAANSLPKQQGTNLIAQTNNGTLNTQVQAGGVASPSTVT